MKKKLLLVAITSLILVFVAGCDSDTSATQAQTDSAETIVDNTTAEADASLKKSSVATDVTKENLEECLSIMGKDDESAASLLGGGKENIAADGATLIGRTYTVRLFGEEAEVATMYDENGCVSIITVELKNPDASVYSEKLKELYGEPTEINDIQSEGGATWESWNIEELQIRLYQQYELSTLEITAMPDANGTETSDEDDIFTGWLPDSVTQTKNVYNYVDCNGFLWERYISGLRAEQE